MGLPAEPDAAVMTTASQSQVLLLLHDLLCAASVSLVSSPIPPVDIATAVLRVTML